MSIDSTAWLWLGGALFCVGLFGAIARRDAVASLVSVMVMAAAAGLNALTVARMVPALRTTGQVLALFALLLGTVIVAGGFVALRRHGTPASSKDDGKAC